MFQSTHPRRVRHNRLYRFLNHHSFNPRTHVGCDTRLRATLHGHNEFQSTHPRRVRLFQIFLLVLVVSFNPRTHVGCDRNLTQVQRDIAVSIHAPT